MAGTMAYKISIITPVRNGEKYLRTAIDSVLAQNYQPCEHIIVDGASTDGTVAILKSYPHLKWISEPDHGPGDAFNKGCALATGDILCILPADDSSSPWRSAAHWFRLARIPTANGWPAIATILMMRERRFTDPLPGTRICCSGITAFTCC